MSLDEVNQDFAAKAAEKYSMNLCFFASPAEMELWPCDVVIYDLDFLYGDDRRQILDELSRRPALGKVAVHSYHLSGVEKRTLQRNGVVVRRRLRTRWLRRLIHAKDREQEDHCLLQ
jgi:hypothetical protein